MNFEFTSVYYKYFLWVTVVYVLLMDVNSFWLIYTGRASLTPIMLILATFGVLLKLGIFVMLVSKDGPIKVLVYIWGGLFILGGVAGLLSLFINQLLSQEPILVQSYVVKALFLVLGLCLVVPLDVAIKTGHNEIDKE